MTYNLTVPQSEASAAGDLGSLAKAPPKKRNRTTTPLNRRWVKELIHTNDLHVRQDYLVALESLVAKKVYDGIQKLKTEGKRITLGVEDLL